MQVGDDQRAFVRPVERAGAVGNEPDPGDENFRAHGPVPRMFAAAGPTCARLSGIQVRHSRSLSRIVARRRRRLDHLLRFTEGGSGQNVLDFLRHCIASFTSSASASASNPSEASP